VQQTFQGIVYGGSGQDSSGKYSAYLEEQDVAARLLDVADVLEDGLGVIVRESRQEVLHHHCVHVGILHLLGIGICIRLIAGARVAGNTAIAWHVKGTTWSEIRVADRITKGQN